MKIIVFVNILRRTSLKTMFQIAFIDPGYYTCRPLQDNILVAATMHCTCCRKIPTQSYNINIKIAARYTRMSGYPQKYRNTHKIPGYSENLNKNYVQ